MSSPQKHAVASDNTGKSGNMTTAQGREQDVKE
jgi:hypothetical protein